MESRGHESKATGLDLLEHEHDRGRHNNSYKLKAWLTGPPSSRMHLFSQTGAIDDEISDVD